MATTILPINLLNRHLGVSRKPPGCLTCAYHLIGNGFCPDLLPPDPIIGFFLEAPGETEIQERKPLTGRAGKLWVKRLVEKLGYKREDVFIGNTLRCRPNTDGVANKYPLGDMARKAERACRQYDGQVRAFNPDLFIVSYHPAAILRTPALYRSTLRSVELAFTKAQEGYRPLCIMGDTALHLVAPHLHGGLRVWNRHWFEGKWPF